MTNQANSKLDLTQREREVIALVARGLANEEIAEQFLVYTLAVKTYLHQACIKLRARNRAQAVIAAFKGRAVDMQEVYSLEEIAELIGSLGPEAIQVMAYLLKRRLQLGMPESEPRDIKQIKSHSSSGKVGYV